MHRPALLLGTAALCALTAVGLLSAGLALRAPAPVVADAEAEAASREVVVRFYDGVNLAIASGDLSLFEAVVAPEFVDRAGPNGVTTDRVGLAAHLRSLHVTAQGASLSIEALVSEEDRVVARIAVRGFERRTFVGLDGFDRLPIWGTIDAFRIAGGRVVERWSPAEPGLMEPLGRVWLGRSLPTGQVVALDRVTLDPGGRLDGSLGDEIRTLALEIGAIQLAVDPASPSPALLSTSGRSARPWGVPPGSTLSLVPGDLITFSARTRFALRAAPGGPARLLIAKIGDHEQVDGTAIRADPAYAASSRPGAATTGAAHEPSSRRLAGGRVLDPSVGSFSVAFGRVTLPPEAAILREPIPGIQLLFVESGALDLVANERDAWVTAGTTGASHATERAVLHSGDGAQLFTGTTVDLRNGGKTPLVVLTVTILPDDAVDAASGV